MSFNKSKVIASMFVWLLSAMFSLFAVAMIQPVAITELGYIPLYALVVIFMPVSMGSIMFAHTLLTELPKTKRFKL